MPSLLTLQKLDLPAGTEWRVPAHPGEAQWFCRVVSGTAYARLATGARELTPGMVLESPAGAGAVGLLASQLGPVCLQVFALRRDQLAGLLTMDELQSLPAVPPARLHAANSRMAGLFAALPDPAHPAELRLALAGVVVAAWAGDLPRPEPAGTLNAADRFTELTRRLSLAELVRRPLVELVAECGCSERHFGRLFRRRFGRSFRDCQVEHRLRTARELLTESRNRVIEIAYEVGFRHLGLFNVMFKRRFGVTPTEYRANYAARRAARRGAARERGLATVMALLLSLVFAPALRPLRAADPATPVAPALGADAPAATNATPRTVTFPVQRYEIEGNTLLSAEVLDTVLAPHRSEQATYDTLRAALTDLQLAYRARGWVTASASLPPQQITNGVVRMRVVEGRLTDIRITGNRWFSSNNVRSSLPSLRTNVFLNSGWFQTELDQANQSRDRQIYPLLGPGPEPGTSSLTLRVKDRFPLHGRLEFNNKGTPGTPDFRLDGSLQYNNLWQREHQVGLQYNFTPEEMKPADRWHDGRFFDQPLNAAYSAYYRMPVGSGTALIDRSDFAASNFGYDPVKQQFVAPPPSGRPELIFFASRSDSDTGIRRSPRNLVADTPLVRIESEATGEDLTVNEGLGTRFQMGLPPVGRFRQSLSFGPDWKHYALSSFNTNTFYSRTTITNDNVPLVIDRVVPFAQPSLYRTVDYLPLTVGWNLAGSDRWGSTSVSLSGSVNLVTLRDHDQRGTNSPTPFDPGHYQVISLTLSREQKLPGDWTMLLRAQGQMSGGSLISNEQFGLGGSQGVRGYREGEEYGDRGWRMLLEPRTRWYELGLVDGRVPMRARFSVFTDYGERYLLSPGTRPGTVRMWGAGFGATVALGETVEARAAFGWALEDAVQTKAGSEHIHLSIGAQF